MLSALIEKHAEDAEKENQVDLADYLINEQITELERYEAFAERYNRQLERVLGDDDLFDEFNSILDEQKSVLIVDGGFSETEAESQICNFENFRQTVLSL